MFDPSTRNPVAQQAPSPSPAPTEGKASSAVASADSPSDIFFAAVQTTRMPMGVTDPLATVRNGDNGGVEILRLA